MYRLILLGSMDLQGSAGSLSGRITQRRQLALLALLASTGDRPLSREKAVGYLWPDSPSTRARARLSDTLYVIRQELGEGAVLPAGDGLKLNPEVVWSDVTAFKEALLANHLLEGVELYGGPFLDGFHPNGGVDFERWVDGERRRLADRFRESLEALAEGAEGEGRWADASGWWRRRAAEEPANSRVAIRLMQALAAGGNVAGALAHARAHEQFLERELEISLPPEVGILAEELADSGGGGDVPRKAPSGPSSRAGEVGKRGESSGDRSPTAAPAQDDLGEADPPLVGEPASSVPAPAPSAPAPPVPAPSASPPPIPAPPPPALAEASRANDGRTRNSRLAAGAMVLAALLLATAWLWGAPGGSDEHWVRETALPQIEALTSEGLYDSAWVMARRAEAIAPGDPDLARLLPEFTWLWPELRTDPSGARVLRRPYADPEAPWEELGSTPLESFRLPLGASVLRLELDGHRPVQVVPDHYLMSFPTLTLDPPERLPEGMVRVPGWEETVEGEAVELADFFMARYPVTNREYLRFVDAGGYREPRYWEHPFVLDGDTLSWEEAMGHFTDRTGRPGPSTWELSSYPDGEGEYPVGGVSWYEAAAYARFAGRDLPSVYHWRRAYGSEFFPEHVIPKSNLHSDGPAAVGEHRGMGPFGTFDMAGNVREWCSNERGAARIILGGGWNDPDHMAVDAAVGPAYTQPPFDRSPTNGIRLVSYLEEDSGLARSLAPVEPRPAPDFLAEARAGPSDEEFAVFRRMYAYDPTPLEPRVEGADTARHWVRKTISFRAAYPGERVLLHLYLPRNASPPFQTVVYWPGAGARAFSSVDQKTELHTGFVVRSGRALAFPVLKGTLERLGDVEEVRPPVESVRFRDRTIKQVQDLRRTIDYLETRGDIDERRLGFYGWSWGGWLAPLVLSMEPRFDAAVLHVAGVSSRRAMPEVDPLNHLPRVTLPVLMLNGRLDAVFPVETQARPFFELLGTPPGDKHFIVTESGHFVPRPTLIRESLDWLDRHLGAVEEG